MRCSTLALIWMLGVTSKRTNGAPETIVVIPRKSLLGRHLATPVAKWERTGGKIVPMKTRTSYCEIESV